MAGKNTKIYDEKAREELLHKYDEKIQQFCLMDNSFMSVVFQDKKCTEILICTILKKNI